MYSRSESSMTIAPTSPFAFWMALITFVIGIPYACSRAGSTSHSASRRCRKSGLLSGSGNSPWRSART